MKLSISLRGAGRSIIPASRNDRPPAPAAAKLYSGYARGLCSI